MFSWLPGLRQVRDVNYLTDLLTQHASLLKDNLRSTIHLDEVETGCDNIYAYIFVAVIVARIHLMYHGNKKEQEKNNRGFLTNFARDLSRQHRLTFEQVWKKIELTDSYISGWVSTISNSVRPSGKIQDDLSYSQKHLSSYFDFITMVFIDNNYSKPHIVSRNTNAKNNLNQVITLIIVNIVRCLRS